MREDEAVTKTMVKLFLFKRSMDRLKKNIFEQKVALFLDCEKAHRDSNFNKEAECQAKIDITQLKIENIDLIIKSINSFDNCIKSYQYTSALISLNKIITVMEGTKLQPSELFALLKLTQSFLEKMASVAYA